MADIRLVKPQANAVHNVPCATGNRFVLDFPSDAALFAKDGDDLVLSFEDGSSIRLQDFYTTYSKEEMPSFEMEGAEISGEDFFAALGNPDLMPAAGPSAAAATRGGGFNQYGNVELLQGIDRLGGLDISFNWGQEHEDDLYAYGHRDIDYGVSVVPVVPGILDPDIPVVDDPDNPNDGGVGPVVDRLEVWEEGLANGSNPGGENVPTVAHGGMNISAPDGVATIVIGEVTVYANGHLVRGSDGAPVKVDTGEGYLQVTGFNPATGRLEYTYTLISATQEHGLSSDHDDEIAHKLTVTVTDSDGDRGSSTIAVVIRDDEPTAYDDTNSITEGDSEDVVCSGNVLDGTIDKGTGTPTKDIIGADGHMDDESKVSWTTDGLQSLDENTYQTKYGTIKLNADGTYEYTLDGENDAVRVLENEHTTLTETFTYTITDADGDTSEATLSITIKGTDHEVLVTNGDTLVVDEADLDTGSKVDDNDFTATAKGFMEITAHDGLETVTIRGIEVVKDGQLVVGAPIDDDGIGTLTVTGLIDHENGTWTLEYTYTLTKATQEHAKPAQGVKLNRNELPSEHVFEVVVTDQDGDTNTFGQITVDIVDDVPTARNDYNSVDEADPTDDVDVVASGNVISGLRGSEVVEESKDTQGADTATVTGIAVVDSDGKPGESSEVSADGIEITGKYGTLTIYSDGSYDYVLDENNREVMKQTGKEAEADRLKDIFSYTITDADGDSSTANLTIEINGKDHEVGELQFAPNPVVVDEADLKDKEGNALGNAADSDPATETAKGSFTVDVWDGLQTLTIDGKDVQLSFAEDGSVTVTEPGTRYQDPAGGGYLTIDSVDGNSGSYTVHYTYHLTGRIEHAEPENQLADRNGLKDQHKFEVEVTDQNGDSKSGEITVQILDDIPVLVGTPSLGGDSVAVSEDNLGADGASVTIELGNAFGNVESKYGADGAAKENEAVYSLRLSGESVTTNLFGLVGEGKEAHYERISLEITQDGDVQGVTEDGIECFTIEINPKTGEATFTLLKPVQHKEGSNSIDLETIGGSLSCVYTITDADGDKAEAILEIGKNVFKIKDAQTQVEAKKDEAQLAVDESFAARPLDTTDRLTKDDDTDSTADKVATFDAKELFTITPGADDQGLEGQDGYAVEHHFALKIVENGIDSGLDGLYVDGNKTMQGDILLFEENGSIVGRVGEETGPEVFTLTIDPQRGEMKLELSGAASIVHDKTTKFDEAVDLADRIQVELTVTDRDGDEDTAYADVTLTFEDDGPALSMPDASGMQTTTDANNMGTITGHMDIDFGADGPAQENAMVVTVKEGDDVEYTFVCEQGENGTWFARDEENNDHTFTVDKDGHFTYSRPVSADGTDDDVTIVVELTDGDGDSIKKETVEYAPTITVDKGEGVVREEGVAGHTYNDDPNDDLNDSNDDVLAISSTSGTITLAQSESGKEDSGALTLSLRGGTITHTTLTLEISDDADTVSQPSDEYDVANIGNITDGMTLYLVKGEGGIVLHSKDGKDNTYGSITFTKDEGSDTWTWKFELEENDLVNSMTEREEIKLELNLGVSDGMLQDDSGKITITIKGTNDLPMFGNGINDYNEAGKNLVTDTNGEGVSGVEHSISGTLRATDPDTDNGDSATAQKDNHLIFSLVGFEESKVGMVGEDGVYTKYGDDHAQRVENLISDGDSKDVTFNKEEGSTSITTKYGTLTVKEDGTFTYTPSDTSAIGKDEYVTETFTVRVTDAHGSWTEKQITITLRDEDASVTTGTDVTLNAKEEGVVGNDADLFKGDYNASVSTQDGEPDAGKGTVLFTDEDLNDTLTLSSTTSSLTWNDKPYSVQFPEIKVGIAGTSTVLYLVASNEGGSWSFAWTESKQGNQDIVGTLTLERTATGDVKASFDLDPQNTTDKESDNSSFLDQLKQGEIVTVELPLQAKSSDSAPATSKLTIKIEGTNDKPVIDSVKGKNDQSLSDIADRYIYPTEDEDSEGSDESSGTSEPDLEGVVTAHDVDRDNGSGLPTTDEDGRGLVFTLNKEIVCRTKGADGIDESKFQDDGSEAFSKEEGQAGEFTDQYTTIKTTYGTLEIEPETGEFTYTLDKPERDEEGNPNPIMELGEGQSVTETYTVRVTDSHGSWTTSEIEITIKGTNDRPVITTTENLVVHGSEENTPDKSYHEEEGDLSTATIVAEDYDLGDKITGFYFYKDGQESDLKDSISITGQDLFDILKKNHEAFSGSENELQQLKEYLELHAGDDVATLQLSTKPDGTAELTLKPNQDSPFLQSMKTSSYIKFELSDIDGYHVVAQDEHNALSNEVNVNLVLHGTDDSTATTSVTVPHVKEEGVYRGESNQILVTDKITDSSVEPGYGQELVSAEGSFTVHDRDVGQIVFKTKDGITIGKETGTKFGKDGEEIDFDSEGTGDSSIYVLGKYGYYEITLDSVMDPDTGSKTFEYTYNLYSDDTPEAVRKELESLSEDLDKKIALVDSIPQGEKVQDPVTIMVNTGKEEDTALSLSATVSGSNDRPFINDVLDYDGPSEKDYTSLKVVSETQPDEPGTESTICFDKEDGTLHITLQSNSDGNNGNSGKYIAQIKGVDPDEKPLIDGGEADGTTVVNYAFVYTNEEGNTVSNVWSIDGSEATSKYGTISIDAKGVIRIELNKDAGKDISQGDYEEIFDGLGVRCIDDLGATSEIVWLSGKLVGVDDDATAIASNESLWEGQHDADFVHSPQPYGGEEPPVLADNETHELTGSIRVTDPDKDDGIGSTVIVTIGENVHSLNLSDDSTDSVPGQNGKFIFWLGYPDPEDGSRNEAILHYTYTYTGDPEDLDHLNIGAQDTLENVKVSFTSGLDENRQTITSDITITAKGTNDAPVIESVNGDSVSDTGEPYDGGLVPARGQAEGNIKFSDVDNAGETYCGFLTYTDPVTEITYYLYGETGADGNTVYNAWYPSEKAGDFDTDGITYKDLVLTNHVELEHGTLYVDDQGHYIYSRKPSDTNIEPENVYVTVSDPHGAMDSVEIKFEFGEDGPGDMLPAIDMNEDVTLPVTEPSEDSDRVYAGAEESYVSSFEDRIREDFKLTLYYTKDDADNPQLVYRDKDDKFVDGSGNSVSEEKLFSATGTLVPDEDGGYTWAFKDDAGKEINFNDFYLEIRFAEPEELNGWDNGTYSMSTDYGTVYVDRETGEIRYELDSRADALNAGQKVSDTVAVWINGHKVNGNLELEVTGTGDASLVEAPSLHVDLDAANPADSGTLQIDDIDNTDTGNNSVNDTHTLEVTLDGDTKLTVGDGTSIYVVATEEQPGYKLVQTSDDVDEDSLYGRLTFTVDSEGQYHYTFTPEADSEASKNLKGGATIDFTIPLTVTDTSPEAESEGDYNNPTTSEADLVITLEGKADEPKITGDLNIGITEEGSIPEDSQGTTAGPGSHAVQGNLVIEDYNEGYSISGLFGEVSQDNFHDGTTVIEGTYGTLVLKQDGSYTYTLKYDEVQSLRAGQEEKDIFTVRVDNGAGQHTDTTITVDVIGENDLPTVTVTPVLSVQEQHGAKPSVSGKVEAQDIDKGDTLTYGIMADDATFVTPTGEEQEASVYVYAAENGGDFVFLTKANGNTSRLVGTLTMDQNGTYTFAPADSDYVRALDAGESINFTVPVGAKDPDGDPVTKPVSITIHGSNENPEITTSIEISENEMLQGSSTGSQYTLTIDPGKHHYSATDAEDGTEGLSYTFERNGEYLTHVETTVTAGEKKYNVSLSIDENGKISLSYGDDLRAAIDALGQGEKLTLASDLNVVVQDGSGGKSPSKLELTVTGDNDAPTDLNASVDEKNGLDGTLSFTDVDATDVHTITFDGLYTNEKTSLSIKTDNVPSEAQPVYDEQGNCLGTIAFVWDNSSKTLGYTFNPAEKYLDSLPVGAKSTILFSVKVTDPHGKSDTQDGLQFTVVNENDVPVLVEDSSGSDEVNTGSFIFTDADLLDSHSVVFDRLQDAEGKPLVFELTDNPSSQEVFYNSIAVGTLTVSYTTSVEGNKVEYSFAPTTDETALNKLPLGENMLQFSANIRDTHNAVSEVIKDDLVVTNANEKPSIDITENTDGFSGTLTISDPDVRDTHTISVLFEGVSYELEDNTVTIPKLGTLAFTQESDGVWSYSLDATDIAAGIAEGTSVSKTFQIQVSDKDGKTDAEDIEVVVHGTNAAPTAESPTYEVTIDNLAQSFSVDLAALASDAEGDALTLSITGINTDGHVKGTYGTLSYDADTNSYFYVLDASDDNLAALAAAIKAEQPLTESFGYTVSDGVNDPVSGSITLNLDLSNLELPVLPEEPEETPGEGETTIPDSSQGEDSSETADAGTDADEYFEAIVYALENGEDDTPLFARNTYSLADGEEMYSLSPDEPEENTVDIVAYDSTDYMVDGGEGVSFMVSDNEDLTMDDILQGDGQNGPIVSNIDVLITGHGAESLTNMDQLARDYGIAVDKDANALTLDESWQKVDSGHTDTQVFSNGSLTLETSLDVSRPSDDLNVQAAMHQVNNN